MQLEIARLSKKGGRKVNEDACDYWASGNLSCCVLSDGLGGHFGGEVASKLAVSSVREEFLMHSVCGAETIEKLLHASDDAIIREQKRNKQLKDMRATAVILLIDRANRMATWGHVGDSRLYCFREGRIIWQTRDHSISQSMVEAGYLKQEELRSSPIRNQLYAALGNGEHFEADILPNEFTINDGDIFLMCSDGLWEYIEESEMEWMLSSSLFAAEWIAALEKQVIMRGHQRQDNYSAIAVWCKYSDDDRTLMPGEWN